MKHLKIMSVLMTTELELELELKLVLELEVELEVDKLDSLELVDDVIDVSLLLDDVALLLVGA